MHYTQCTDRFAGEEVAQQTQRLHQDVDVGISEELEDLVGAQCVQDLQLDGLVGLEGQVL